MANVLIIGSNGTLGQYLSLKLSLNHEVTRFGEKISNKDKRFEKILNLVTSSKINCIVNTAGATNVNLCEENCEYAFDGNTLVPKIIRRVQELCGSDIYVINFSTDQVYHGLGNSAEDDVGPQNQYGKSKLAGEQFLTQNACNLRINYVSRGVGRLSFSDWVVQSARSKEQVHLYSDVYFNPVDLFTLGSCVEKVIATKIVGTINVGSKSKLSKSDFYLKLTQNLGIRNPNIKIVNYSDISNVPRPLDMSMNVSKAKKLGFNLPSLDEVIKNLATEYKKCQ